MELDEKEIEDLRRQCAESKLRCRETYGTILKLKKLLSTYQRIHTVWRVRHEEADRKLAEVDGRLHVVSDKRSLKEETKILQKLSKKQLLALAEELRKEVGESE